MREFLERERAYQNGNSEALKKNARERDEKIME